MANKNKKNERKMSLVVVFILIIIGIVAFFGIGYKSIFSFVKEGSVELKPINTTFNGEHPVSLKIGLSGNERKLNKLDLDNIQLATTKIIENLDYDKIKQQNGSEYIKQEVLKGLKEQYGDVVEEVYLTEFLNDVGIVLPPSSGNKNSLPTRDELLKSFGWSKNK